MKNADLTPEEIAELNSLEQTELDESEAAELAELEAVEAQQPENSQSLPESESLIDKATGMATAAYAGGMPFLPQLQGAGAAISDIAMGNVTSISELADSYTQNRDSAKQAQKDLEAKYPSTYQTAESAKVFGGMATTSVIPGLNATVAARTAVAAGFSLADSALEDAETKEAFQNGIASGGISLGVDIASKGMIKGAGRLAESTAVKSIGALATKSVKRLREMTMKGVTNAQLFFDDVVNGKTLDGKSLISVSKPMEDIAQDASELATFHGKQMGAILSEVDKLNGGLPSVDGNILAARAAAKLQGSRDLTQLNPDDMAEITKLQTFIQTAFTNKQFKLTDLHDIKTSLKGSYDLRKASFELSKSDRIYKGIVDDLSDVIDNSVRTTPNPELGGIYLEAKRKFATMSAVADTAREQSLKGPSSIIGDIRENLVRNIAIAGIGGAASSNQGSSFAAGAALGAVLFNASRNPGVNTAIAKSLGRLGNALAKNPQRYNIIAQRLAASASIGDQEFLAEAGAAEAEIELDASPLDRSSVDVLAKKDMLFALLTSKGIDTSKLRGAVDKSDGDTIASFMSDLSKEQSMKSYIKPGIGWDGKVSNPEDIAVVQTGIRSNKALSPRQKRLMEDELMTSGKIPTTPAPKNTETQKMSRRIKTINRGSLGEY